MRLKNKRVLDKIHQVSQLWPKKKEFIEGAYKILLFSKGQRKFGNAALAVFKETPQLSIIDNEYFDYPLAFRRVLKSWYERRMREETEKNRKLVELHSHLLQIRELRMKELEIGRRQSEQEIAFQEATDKQEALLSQHQSM